MLIFSGVIDTKIAVQDDFEVKNCFLCNFDFGAISVNSYVEIAIDSCFFEENTNWENGGAIAINDAKKIVISKIFGKACATKSVDKNEMRVSQFGYMKVKSKTDGDNILFESCISSSAPFIELEYNRRSVIELSYGNVNAENLNFSNNIGKRQVFLILQDDDKEAFAKYITYYRNDIAEDYIVYNNNGVSNYIENQFIENNVGSNKIVVCAYQASTVILKRCCFYNVENCNFDTQTNCIIRIDSCHFQHNIGHLGTGNYQSGGANIAQQPTLQHIIMRDGIKNVVKKGFCSDDGKSKGISLVVLSSFVLNKGFR